MTAPGHALPDATGSLRIGWAQVPARVASGIEHLLGSAVVDAVSQPGGFSEGLAARVRLADGRRAFVKAASSLTAPAAADFHRREIAITRQLPATVAVPRLLDAYDDGVWVALVFEEIPGRLPLQPWRREELDRTLAAVTDLALALTPTTVDTAILGRPRLGGWLALIEESTVDRVRALSPWAADHLDVLAALEQRAALATAGRTLLNGDLYPFNILLTAERVYFVDWPHAWVGAAHCDAVTLMSSASLSGVDPQALAARHPLTRDLDPDQINVLLALHAGFLFHRACSVGPVADRRLVDMMVALGAGSLGWLRSRL